jgi:hypothetical protein
MSSRIDICAATTYSEGRCGLRGGIELTYEELCRRAKSVSAVYPPGKCMTRFRAQAKTNNGQVVEMTVASKELGPLAELTDS